MNITSVCVLLPHISSVQNASLQRWIYCPVLPVCYYCIFSHYLIKGKILGGKKSLLKIKRVFFIFSTTFSEVFLIWRRIQRAIINVYDYSCKVAVILFRFWLYSNLLHRFFQKKKRANINFNENPSCGSRVVLCWWTHIWRSK